MKVLGVRVFCWLVVSVYPLQYLQARIVVPLSHQLRRDCLTELFQAGDTPSLRLHQLLKVSNQAHKLNDAPLKTPKTARRVQTIVKQLQLLQDLWGGPQLSKIASEAYFEDGMLYGVRFRSERYTEEDPISLLPKSVKLFVFNGFRSKDFFNLSGQVLKTVKESELSLEQLSFKPHEWLEGWSQWFRGKYSPRTIRFKGSSFFAPPPLLQELLRKVNTLEFSGTQENFGEVQKVLDSCSFERLEHLTLQEEEDTPLSVAFLAKNPSLFGLKTLRLVFIGSGPSSWTKTFNYLTKLKNLESLELEGALINDHLIDLLTQLPRLRRLVIRNASPHSSAQWVHTLATRDFSGLRELDLSYNRNFVTDRTVTALLNNPSGCNLKTLSLIQNTRLGNLFYSTLARAKHLKGLRRVDFQMIPVSVEQMKSLHTTPDLSRVRFIVSESYEQRLDTHQLNQSSPQGHRWVAVVDPDVDS